MRQFTTPEQTAKLIGLGFKNPKNRIGGEIEEILKVIVQFGEFKIPINSSCLAYSIGELIEMLPKEMDCELGDLGLTIENNIYEQPNEWIVSYDGTHQTNSIELVDALCDMILKLKEEGVI